MDYFYAHYEFSRKLVKWSIKINIKYSTLDIRDYHQKTTTIWKYATMYKYRFIPSIKEKFSCIDLVNTADYFCNILEELINITTSDIKIIEWIKIHILSLKKVISKEKVVSPSSLGFYEMLLIYIFLENYVLKEPIPWNIKIKFAAIVIKIKSIGLNNITKIKTGLR